MGKFTKIAQSTFDELVVDAGVILTEFDPENPELVDENIVCATTGGINPTCVPTYSDWGEDVDNCPNGMMELMHLDGWETSLGFTALNITPEAIKLALGVADIEGNKIVPRRGIDHTKDFRDIWWVGDRSDDGFVAIRLINALSTSGFSLQTTKNGKGQLAVTLGGHVSIKDQDTVPMEFYVYEGASAEEASETGT